MDRHPYEKYKTLESWKIMDKAVEDLIENNDLEEKTDRSYIIGYILKSLDQNGFLKK